MLFRSPPQILRASHLEEIDVRTKLAFRLSCVLFLSLNCFPAIAQQFSADMVRLKPEGAVASKVVVLGDRVRLDLAGPVQEHNATVILNLTQNKGFMIIPDNKSYVPLPAGPASAAMPFFEPANPENACPAWEKATDKPGTCTKIGDDTLAGRPSVKYKGTSGNGDTGFLWIDRRLNFVVKWQGQRSSAELRNIQEGPQSPTMFEIPTDYEKVDPQAERAKSAKAKATGKSQPATATPQNE
jgi:hypothetical protein